MGAKNGLGEGLSGKTYAIPTKDENLNILPLSSIKRKVDMFIDYAKFNYDLTFLVTKIGTGLAGYSINDIGPLFIKAKDVENIYLPQEFWDIVEKY